MQVASMYWENRFQCDKENVLRWSRKFSLKSLENIKKFFFSKLNDILHFKSIMFFNKNKTNKSNFFDFVCFTENSKLF